MYKNIQQDLNETKEIERLRVYLDWNVIVSLKDGDLPDLYKALLTVRQQGTLLPFSFEHLEEIDRIKADSESKRLASIREHLDFLSSLSENIYLVKEENQAFFHETSPQEVYPNLELVSAQRVEIEKIVTLVSMADYKQARDMLNLDPSRLNNIQADQLVQGLDEALNTPENREKYGQPFGGDINMEKIVEMAMSFLPKDFPMTDDIFITMLYSMVDSLGYWPDKPKKTDDYARYIDACHAASAAYCHYLISDDKSLLKKAKAIYATLNIGTRVLNTRELQLELEPIT